MPYRNTQGGGFAPFSGLDYLASAVLLMDAERCLCYANSAAQNLLGMAGSALIGRRLGSLIRYGETLEDAFEKAISNDWGYTGQNVEVRRSDREDARVLHLNCTVTPIHCKDAPQVRLLLELHPIDQQLKINREERLLEQQLASRELIRNLAHEIKNPLGGIRGAAQLLEHELADPELTEYTQVIIQEVDRLQGLMERLLAPHRVALQPRSLNIHEILERVRSLLLLEFPDTLTIVRDYDVSLPEQMGDREQLIQVFLNIARNAAEAMAGVGEIILRTRAIRQVTLARRRFRLAVEISVIDNGPGIPEAMRERVFYPLVSGRPEGTGLGLTLAQSLVFLHQGTIEVESRVGYTRFFVRLPVEPC